MSSLLDVWFGRQPAPVPLTLYSRPACHLCELMKAELARARVGRPYTLQEIDIDSDPQLVERFGHSIPVLAIAGRVAFKTKLTAAEFERKFARLADEWTRAQLAARESHGDGERV